MEATTLLKQEHIVIKKVLAGLQGLVDRREVRAADIRDALTFSRTFVDRCHHGKEELCLFPCMEKRGIPREHGPIAVMLLEHEQGRQLVRAIGEALDRHEAGKAAPAEVLARIQEYVELLEAHIEKENNILYAMGDQVMQGRDDPETVSCFDAKEAERIDPETHRAMVALAERLGSLRSA